MPQFKVDEYMRIDPDEFLSECSHKELQETYDLLIDDYDVERDGLNEEDNDSRSPGQMFFNRNLRALRDSWLSVTKEDADIIAILGKKYGMF